MSNELQTTTNEKRITLLTFYRILLFATSIYFMQISAPTEPIWGALMALWAAIFLVPIGAKQTILRSVATENSFEIDGFLQKMQPVAASFLTGSFWIKQGNIAGLMAVFYLLWCVAVLLPNLLRFRLSLPFLALLAAWGFLTNAAVWLVFDRFDVQPLGFSNWIVLLTGAHFHYAGFALMLSIALFLTENPNNNWAKTAAYAVLFGVVLTATGITTTQLSFPHWIETFAGVCMAFAATFAGIFFIKISRSEAIKPLTARLWLAGGSCLFGTMLLALLYALRPVFPISWLGIPFMQAVHGSFNALGFGTLMLLGWHFKE